MDTSNLKMRNYLNTIRGHILDMEDSDPEDSPGKLMYMSLSEIIFISFIDIQHIPQHISSDDMEVDDTVPINDGR